MRKAEEEEGQKVCSHQPEGASMTMFKTSPKSARRAGPALLLVGLALLLVVPSVASAGALVPNWRVVVQPVPTNMPPGGEGQFTIFVENVGDAPSHCQPVTVVDHLPPGMIATEAGSLPFGVEEVQAGMWGEEGCAGAGTETVTCTYDEALAGGEPIRPYEFDGKGAGTPGQPDRIGINVSVPAGPEHQALRDEVTMSGGGATRTASGTASAMISSSPAPFGVEAVHEWFTNPDGTPDTQAGSHPYEMATNVTFNSGRIRYGLHKQTESSGEVKDVHLDLPAGLVGNVTATPQCPRSDFYAHTVHFETDCPPDTQVGVVRAFLATYLEVELPIYNLVPPAGLPLQLAFAGGHNDEGLFDVGVATGAGYNVTVDLRDLPEVQTADALIEIWGNPADPSHDGMRFFPSENL